MNPTVLIIWFNPQNNINTIKKSMTIYSSIFKTVYVVDNSTGDNSEICKDITNLEYIPLHENLGIAKALNIGCKKANEDGFDWILTMDQDSLWEENTLKKYVSFSNKIINEYDNVKSIAAKPNTVHSVLYEAIVKIKPKSNEKDFVFCDRCICSGNFIELNTWKTIGGFNEELFIDEVDHDYCFRLREKDFKIVQSNLYTFIHSIGDEKKSFLPCVDKHGSFRLYYMVRNRLFIIKKYPKYSKQFHYRLYMFIMFFQKCFFDEKRKENLEIFKNANRDYKTLISNGEDNDNGF